MGRKSDECCEEDRGLQMGAPCSPYEWKLYIN